jgi:hypothetical protein
MAENYDSKQAVHFLKYRIQSTEQIKASFSGHQPTQIADDYSDPDLSDSLGDISLPRESRDPTTDDLIFQASLQLERDLPISTRNILNTQQGMTPGDREAAVRRIIQFNYHFKLSSDACYNAITYLDIILSTIQIPVADLDLTAIVCYCISAKVDTRMQLGLDAVNQLSGTGFTSEQIRSTEMQILLALNFQLSFPTVKMFMRRILQRTEAPTVVYEMSNLLTEILVMKFKFLDIKPSMMAGGAVAVSFGSIGNLQGGRQALIESRCQAEPLLTECLKLMVTSGRRLTAAGGKVSEPSNIKELLTRVTFDFDVQSLL